VPIHGARAFRWRELLEIDVFATVDEITTAEKINASYVGRVLRLTLLAPDIVKAILDGCQPSGLTLALLMKPFSVAWDRQRAMGVGSGASRWEPVRNDRYPLP